MKVEVLGSANSLPPTSTYTEEPSKLENSMLTSSYMGSLAMTHTQALFISKFPVMTVYGVAFDAMKLFANLESNMGSEAETACTLPHESVK